MSLLTTKKGALLLLLVCQQATFAISSLTKNDPYPVYTTLDPHLFLNVRNRLRLNGFEVPEKGNEHVRFSFSPYGQNADMGKNMKGFDRNLGDINGRWNMIGLLFGKTPEGQSLGTSLTAAKIALFPTPKFPEVLDGPEEPFIDVNEQFGFFTIPIKYRRRGMRFEVGAQIISDIGLMLQLGGADICQTVTGYENLTTDATFPLEPSCVPCTIAKEDVDCYLMNKYCQIAKEIGLDINNFHKFAIEDIRMGMYWRHAYQINKTNYDWPLFLLIPFINVDGSVGIGKEKNPNEAWALSFGNNGHSSLGATVGLNIDFAETVEIGCEFGATHFFPKDFCDFRVPTSKYQSGIYPFKTDVHIRPGANWHFGAKMFAHHFIDKLSFHIQYLIEHHEEDHIDLKNPGHVFKPEYLEQISSWKTQVANVGFNYDISPNISLGFLWQAPLNQKNTYRTTTIMFSFNAIY